MQVLTLPDVFLDESCNWLVEVEGVGRVHNHNHAAEHGEQPHRDREYGPLTRRWYDRTAAALRSQPGGWPKLLTVRTHRSVGLFWLPLGCTVERLELSPEPGPIPPAAHMYAHLRPRVVVLPWGTEHERSGEGFVDAVEWHLRPLERARSVTHLTVACPSGFVAPRRHSGVADPLFRLQPDVLSLDRVLVS